MRRMKLNRGGDGDAHHRSTFDRASTTNSFVGACPVKRMIPLAESPSSVLFRSFHPQRKNFWLNFWINYDNFCPIKIRENQCNLWKEKRKMNFLFAFCSLIRNFAIKIAKLLHLGIKKKRVSFVLRSIFRNFAPTIIIRYKTI